MPSSTYLWQNLPGPFHFSIINAPTHDASLRAQELTVFTSFRDSLRGGPPTRYPVLSLDLVPPGISPFYSYTILWNSIAPLALVFISPFACLNQKRN
jgi:hypothetical protein